MGYYTLLEVDKVVKNLLLWRIILLRDCRQFLLLMNMVVVLLLPKHMLWDGHQFDLSVRTLWLRHL
ncbi:Alanine--tRNA ligase [Bienertia sinuspersici]